MSNSSWLCKEQILVDFDCMLVDETLLIWSSSLLMGKTMSWKTCLVKVMALTAGVVVNFMKAGLGGSIQPSRKRKRGWFPNGIIDSSTQKMACSGW